MVYGESCTFSQHKLFSPGMLPGNDPAVNWPMCLQQTKDRECFVSEFRARNIRRKIITETSVSTLVWRWSYCAEVGRNFVRTAWVTLKCFNHELIFPQVRQWSHIRLIKLSRLTWTIRAAKNGCNWRKKFVNRSVMYSRYITVNFHWKTYERFPISRQRGRGIRCHSWVPGPVYFS